MLSPKAIQTIDEIWRRFPHTFAQRMSRKKWRPWPYLKLISEAISEAVDNGGGQIIIELPPRHGKSEFISYWVPCWFLDEFPDKKVILTSYEADFAAHWGRRVRNEIETNPLSRVQISDDSSAANRWDTTEGGGMVTAGVGGPIVGRGGHLLIIDDPVKNWQQAVSETYQKATLDWFHSTFWTRREPGAVVVVLMQRWTENDLVGHLTTDSSHKGKWKRIRLPALAEEGDPIGRQLDEPLCPERYDQSYLLAMRDDIKDQKFSALFQQRPSPIEGEIIKRDQWKFYRVLPEMDEIIQSWDLTFKDTQSADFVVGQVWGRRGIDKYWIDQVRERMSFTKTIARFQELTERYPKAKLKLVEEAANGAALIDTLQKKITGIVAVRANDSKYNRALAAAPEAESGHVWLPHPDICPAITAFIEEWAMFPNGRNDDQVDAMTQAMARFALRKTVNYVPLSMTQTSKWVR